ncbi:MAG: hypothetical protein PHI79_07380 [Sulfurovaceae bacterium]|nr:hypothetical protein [Sulfurovaceae bacterium]MDD5549395.1 hypothetical protein [Sulfurovaceae bacterium]
MFNQTILTAVGIIWFVIWIIYLFYKNRDSEKGWFKEKIKDLIIPPKEMFLVGSRKTVMLFVVGLFLINTSYWLKERAEWVNEKHAYLDAKEYYAVGNVLLFYRAISASILSPENNLLQPLEWLQRAIVSKGVSLIPKEDAEWAMWEYRFFWYLYIRNTHIPKQAHNLLGKIVTYNTYMKPWITDMLDDIYKGLDDLANKPMKDAVFENEKYLAYPTLGMYYDFGYAAYYSKNLNASGSMYNFVKVEDAIIPLQNSVRWMEKMQSEWEAHPEALKEINAKPRLQIAQQTTILLNLMHILNNKMYQGTFRCDDPWLLKVYPYSKAFNAKDAPLTKVSEEEQFIYTVANRQLEMVSYTAYKLCGYERLKGDTSNIVEEHKDDPVDGNITIVYQLYYYAKKGLEEHNKTQNQIIRGE